MFIFVYLWCVGSPKNTINLKFEKIYDRLWYNLSEGHRIIEMQYCIP